MHSKTASVVRAVPPANDTPKARTAAAKRPAETFAEPTRTAAPSASAPAGAPSPDRLPKSVQHVLTAVRAHIRRDRYRDTVGRVAWEVLTVEDAESPAMVAHGLARIAQHLTERATEMLVEADTADSVTRRTSRFLAAGHLSLAERATRIASEIDRS